MNDRPFEPLHAAYHAPLDGISERIAADDVMFQGREKHYRNVGQSAWRCLTAAMLTAGVDTPRRILDLPCGHGRVLRVLKRAFPEAALTACDLDQSGVDFCAEEFAATPVYSHQDMSQVQFDEPFDLIWCGSLVTHLDQQGWLQTFQLFLRSLQPNGLAVITFHGRWVAYLMQQGRDYQLSDDSRQRVLADYARTGFGYADYGSQNGYGISLSQPSWVLRELSAWHQLRVVSLCERQWDGHHDVIVVQRVQDAD